MYGRRKLVTLGTATMTMLFSGVFLAHTHRSAAQQQRLMGGCAIVCPRGSCWANVDWSRCYCGCSFEGTPICKCQPVELE
jgi:hypothetical protein